MKPSKRIVLPVLAVVLLTCGTPVESDPPAPNSISVTPATVSLAAIGAETQLVATVHDQYGDAMPEVSVTWTSLSPSVATVSSSGVVVAVGNGAAEIRATASGVTESVQATVSQEVATVIPAAGDGQSAVAGSDVAVRPAVQLVDTNGNAVAEKVVAFTILSGGGTLTESNATSNPAGIATVGSWKVGTLAGLNELQAGLTGLPPILFSATGISGPATIIAVSNGDGQSGTVGTAVSEAPSVIVSDNNSNPVAGVSVTFTVLAGGGSVTGDVSASNAEGVAMVDGWILGITAGENTLQAKAVGTPEVTFTATGTADEAASISVHAGNAQTAAAGASVTVAPAALVRDLYNNPVLDEAVTFAVTSGGGFVTAGATTTDINGVATVGSWTLGPTSGVNTLDATVPGLTPATYTAYGTGGSVFLTVAQGDDQAVLAGANVVILPAVVATDVNGAPVSGVPVDFGVTGGGGSVSGAMSVSNADGVATVGSWRLGVAPGVNELTATSPGLTPVRFAATGIEAGFDVEIRHLVTPSAVVAAAFANAETRWENLVVGDLSDIDFSASPIPANECGITHPGLSDVIDDLMIWVRLEGIDGVGGVLGAAGPCLIRTSPSVSTIVGIMLFDTADLDNLAASGGLEDVILHEVGHVLGFGTLWSDYGLLRNPSLPANPGVDTHFDGEYAIAAFDQIGGTSYTGGQKVPVENQQGGSGTRDGHWRESVFDNELMTGFLNPGGNPLSMLSVASLADLTLIVNPDGADEYNGVFFAQSPTPARPLINLVNDVWRGPIISVDPSGVIRRIR